LPRRKNCQGCPRSKMSGMPPAIHYAVNIFDFQ
jgi:hypothetical protein